jgi:broad specificity polyphosphatase/5'/3'-nucleotidase SurE
MAANTTPIFILSGDITPARLTAYNTSTTTLTTTGTPDSFDLVVAGTNGTRVDGVRLTASATVTAAAASFTNKIVRIFICDIAANANPRVITEYLFSGMVANNVTNTTVRPTTLITFDQPIILKSTQKLVITMCNGVTAYASGDQLDATPYAGDY